MPAPSYKIFRRRSKATDNADKLDDNNEPISNPTECYACTQVGVPVFHSSRCDHANQLHCEPFVGSSLVPISDHPDSKTVSNHSNHWRRFKSGFLRRVYNPRSKRVQRWNRFFLLARGMALAVDPLFFHALSIGGGGRGGVPCLYMDGVVAAMVMVMRTLVDCIHAVYIWLQFRMAYVSRESLVVGCGKLVWDQRLISSHYFGSVKGFWFDLLVILPVPQVVFWLVMPRLIHLERVDALMATFFFIFIFQFLPKVYHLILLTRRMAKVTGYIFGTMSWGFVLNLVVYLIASHVVGACWYAFAIQRVLLCIREQCNKKDTCNLALSCADEVCFQLSLPETKVGDRCAGNSTTSSVGKSLCLDIDGPYNYGIYGWALPAISSNSFTFKILYTFFWGLFSLGTFGNNLAPTSHWFEVIFSICVVFSGLMLFILLIGNIQVFLEHIMKEKSKMERRCRDMEWWMKRRQLPSLLRQRVRHHERQNWALMGGEDEMELIKDLPEGLRRDIKRFIYLELIQMVPLFHNLDDLILDNICDRVKPLVFSKNEKIIREGDVVQRMVFIVQGHVKSCQNLSKGVVTTRILEPGGYLGDELLSWCLRRPFINKLPTSFATFTCMEHIEAFAIDAIHLRYVTNHFRNKFANERLKRSARYYSLNWRTWAAVNIQLGWRQYVVRRRGAKDDIDNKRKIRQYAAIFMPIKPHDDHLE
ncbi:hypothetical protein SSX86_006524 [Deinandra increscens subsp. villosa]|uniref:Cyclic nucleotide-binding domain-containing protein n=1 Tax=Deinandra increscens subsp. villosa TaxID=3103831 RepID=A0AAP0DEY8_9ASTR